MSQKSWEIPLFYQYLLSYLLVLGIPILIIGFTVYSHFVSLMKEQSFEANRSMLAQVRDIVDSKYREIMSMAGTISNDPTFSSNLPETTYDILLAKNRLNFSAGNKFVEELMFYPRDGEYIFSYKSSYGFDFFKEIYQFQEWKPAQLKTEMELLKKPKLLLATRKDGNSVSNQIVYMIPIPVNSLKPKGTAVFSVNESSYQDLFKTSMKLKVKNTFVINRDGQVLTSLYPFEQLDRDIFQRVDLSDDEGTSAVKSGKEWFHVSYAKSQGTGWTYVTIVPDLELMRPVTDIKNKSIFAAILVVVIGVLLIYAGMRMNYNPLRLLIRQGDAKWGSLLRGAHGFESIRKIMEHAESIQERLNEQVEFTTPALREHLLNRLLKGQFHNKEHFNEEGQGVGLTLNQSTYQVAILQFGDRLPGVDEDKHNFYKIWHALFREGIEVYLVDLIEDGRTACIISIDENEPWSEQDWQQLHERFTEQTSMSITLGVGNPSSDVGRLYKSFIEASTSLQYSIIKGKNKVIFFRETSAEQNDRFWYPDHELTHLIRAIHKNETEEILKNTDLLIDKIRDNSTTMFMATYLCFDVVQSVWKTMQELYGNKFQYEPFPDVMTLTRMESFDELASIVLEVCSFAVTQMNHNDHSTEDELYQAMLHYIEQNGFDYHFSVQNMAESLSWSASHIRRVFKEKSNMTISEYVNEQRIIRAKHLLITTKSSLQDIVSLIGYTDVSSFIRKFKQYTHTTPGDYRKLNAIRECDNMRNEHELSQMKT